MKHYSIAGYVGLLLLFAALAGCGSSPPSRHYVLTPHPGEPPGRETPSLGVGPISVPEYLNRNSLVYDQQGNRVQVSATERWAEPLEDGLTRVISLNLAVLVGTQNVRLFPWNARRAPDYAIKVNLLRLDANASEALLVAEWLVYRPDTAETVRRRISKIQRSLPAGEFSAQQVAPAYSDLVYQLSEIIAEAITSAEAERAAAPPG